MRCCAANIHLEILDFTVTSSPFVINKEGILLDLKKILWLFFYRAMHVDVVLARYCYRKSSVRPSVCLSVCDVEVPWAYRLY